MSILQIFLILTVPFLAQKMENRIKKIPAVLSCYALGILIANTSNSFSKVIFKDGYEIAVVLGMAMVLIITPKNFTKKLNGKLLKAYGLHILCLLISILIVSKFIPTAFLKEKMAMIFAVATGGTANMNAVALAINAPSNLFIEMNATDIFFSSIYLLALLGIATIWRKEKNIESTVSNSYKPNVKNYAELLGKSIVVIGGSAGIAFLISGRLNETLFLISLTTLAILVSQSRFAVSEINNRLPDYMFLIFSFCLGAVADFSQLDLSLNNHFIWYGTIYILTIFLFFLLGKVFRFDLIDQILSSVAGIFGPPFIEPVAKAYQRSSKITEAIMIATLGNIIANYLTLAFYYVM